MKIDPKLDLVFERFVEVSPELVWTAWTQPEHLKKWFTPAPWTTVDCEIDLRPGGVFRTVMRSPEGKDHPNTGCVWETDRDDSLFGALNDENLQRALTSAMTGIRARRDAGFADFDFTKGREDLKQRRRANLDRPAASCTSVPDRGTDWSAYLQSYEQFPLRLSKALVAVGHFRSGQDACPAGLSAAKWTQCLSQYSRGGHRHRHATHQRGYAKRPQPLVERQGLQRLRRLELGQGQAPDSVRRTVCQPAFLPPAG